MTDIPVDGYIDKARVDWVISRAKQGDKIVFNSRGGNMYEADRLAKFIRQNNLDTHVNATGVVQSAAVLPFAAGTHRTAGSGATFTLHSPYQEGNGESVVDAGKKLFSELMKYGVHQQIGSMTNMAEPFTFNYTAARSLNLVNTDPPRQSTIIGPLD